MTTATATATPTTSAGRTAPRVLVGYDASETAVHALDWAAAEAERRGWPLHIAQAYDLTAPTLMASAPAVAAAIATQRATMEPHMQELAESVMAGAPGLQVTAEFVARPVAGYLVEQSAEPGMVVVGTRGRSPMASTLLGGTSDEVVTHARGMVVVVPGPARPDGPVVAAVDGSIGSAAIVERAIEHARFSGSNVEVVRCWDIVHPLAPVNALAVMPDVTLEARNELSRSHAVFVDRLAQAAPDVDVTATVVDGAVVGRLLERSASARLVVVGSRGRGGFTGLLLGSTSREVLSRSSAPVAVVPHRRSDH